MNTRRIAAGAVVALLLAGGGAAALVLVDGRPEKGELGEVLRREASAQRIERHLAAFEQIAREGGGDRAAGTRGARASMRYVVRSLRGTGYEITIQDFEFRSYRLLAPTQFDVAGRAVPATSFTPMVFSPAGRAEGPVARPGAGSDGCDASDFAGFPLGAVALVSASDCTYRDQAAAAEAAGAEALLVFPRPRDAPIGVLRGLLGRDPAVDIPVLGITYRLARSLVDGTEVGVVVRARDQRSVARNVIAQTGSGDEPVLMLGAHLDSAVGSPGINDNGSGSATLLALAEAMADEDLDNAVRFAWWDAEEYGLLGSIHYVRSLSEREREEIGAYLNFDMTGSPNFVRYVYEGEGEPEGSEAIEEFFLSWFEERGLEAETIPLQGRSDHAAFASAEIPVGGLFTGANMLKTRAEVEDYGGTPGSAEDPCYHLPCDDLDNVDREVLAEIAAAAAHAIAVMANTPGVIP